MADQLQRVELGSNRGKAPRVHLVYPSAAQDTERLNAKNASMNMPIPLDERGRALWLPGQANRGSLAYTFAAANGCREIFSNAGKASIFSVSRASLGYARLSR